MADTQSNGCVFVTISQVGICNDRGKTLIGYGYRGKVVTKPNRPISGCVDALLSRISDIAGWDTIDLANRDLDTAIKMIEEYRHSISANK